MNYFRPSADASDSYRPSASAATPSFTPTAVEANLADLLRAGVVIVHPRAEDAAASIDTQPSQPAGTSASDW
jgi:hypothetical protein